MRSPGSQSNTTDGEEILALANRLTRDTLESQVALYMAVSLMIIVILVGSAGNVMVILAVRTTKKLQTVSNAFVVNLSVCDLVFVTIVLPFNIYTYLIDGWNLPTFLCKIIGFLGYTLTGTTIITITLIAWNRYKLVVDSQGYQRIFSQRNIAAMLGVAWVLPMMCLLPALMEVWGRFGYVSMMVTCNLLLDHDSQSFKLFLLIVRAAIPCFLIIYYYVSIYRTTKASHRRVRKGRPLASTAGRLDQMIQRKEMHLTKMMATIFIVFALSYFPCTISSIVDWNTVLSKRFHMFCLITVYVGSAINPLIYGLMNSQFRRAYYSILLCRCYHPGAEDIKGKAPTPSPSLPHRIYTKKTKPKKQQESQKTTGQAGNTPLISPKQSENGYSESHSQAVSSSSTNVCTYRRLSTEATSPTSSPSLEGKYSRTLRRTATEQTCTGDCHPDTCHCADPFKI